MLKNRTKHTFLLVFLLSFKLHIQASTSLELIPSQTQISIKKGTPIHITIAFYNKTTTPLTIVAPIPPHIHMPARGYKWYATIKTPFGQTIELHPDTHYAVGMGAFGGLPYKEIKPDQKEEYVISWANSEEIPWNVFTKKDLKQFKKTGWYTPKTDLLNQCFYRTGTYRCRFHFYLNKEQLIDQNMWLQDKTFEENLWQGEITSPEIKIKIER